MMHKAFIANFLIEVRWHAYLDQTDLAMSRDSGNLIFDTGVPNTSPFDFLIQASQQCSMCG